MLVGEEKREAVEPKEAGMGTAREDVSLKLPVFHGTGRDDAKQHWFTCETVWAIKQTPNEQEKIAQLETTSRERDLMWYMKFKATTPAGQTWTLNKRYSRNFKIRIRVAMHHGNQGN